MTDSLPCFSFACGRILKMQSDSKDTPAIRSNGGASRCQLITEPAGYSVNNTSAKWCASIERNKATWLIRGKKAEGTCFPFERRLLLKFQSLPKLATLRLASKPWKTKVWSVCCFIAVISSFSCNSVMKSG